MLDLGLSEPLIILITVALMFLSLFLILIPSVPVTTLEWAIAIIFGALTGFSRLPLPVVVVITVMMIASITSGIWMPLIGLRGRKVSCMAMVGFFVGMILGTAIPIPLIGNFIGGMLGVFLVEFLRSGDYDHAMNAGEGAMIVIILSMIVEFTMAILVVIITVASIFLTA